MKYLVLLVVIAMAICWSGGGVSNQPGLLFFKASINDSTWIGLLT